MKKRVLIVDDEANIRQLTRLALEAAGYEVGEAASGVEAFALFDRDARWDAVLLDQKMPGLTGTGVLKRLKVVAPDLAVIMMTAFASVELAVEAMKLGATDFVRKPMTPKILRNALSAALEPTRATTASAVPSVEPGQYRPFGAITLNGFRIMRAADLRLVLPHRSNEEVFIVRRPDGREEEVRVEIAAEALDTVEQLADRFPVTKSFWTNQAEKFLTDFIWNDGGIPTSGRLTLRGVEREDLEKALRQERGK